MLPRPLEKVGVVIEPDHSVLVTFDDPRPLGVVLRDGVAIIGHERMFASLSRAANRRRARTDRTCCPCER